MSNYFILFYWLKAKIASLYSCVEDAHLLDVSKDDNFVDDKRKDFCTGWKRQQIDLEEFYLIFVLGRVFFWIAIFISLLDHKIRTTLRMMKMMTSIQLFGLTILLRMLLEKICHLLLLFTLRNLPKLVIS